jgi:hypothetical protein
MKTATEAQLKLLALISNFGYLTTRELAILAYPRHSPNSAIKAAQKSMTRLRADGLVMARELPYDGHTNSYVLSRAAADQLCDHHCALWFGHGYDLQMNDLQTRRPLIDLLGSLAGQLDLEPVGSRGMAWDYQELKHLKVYDALLVNANHEPVYGVALIHGFNGAATKRIRALAARALPFLIATTNEPRLRRLMRERHDAAPEMAETIEMLLPAGVVA